MSLRRLAAPTAMFLLLCLVATPATVVPQTVTAPQPVCAVDPTRELIITNLAVVNNTLRTTWDTILRLTHEPLRGPSVG